MPTVPTISALATQLDNGIKAFGADPLTALKKFDFKTVGLVGAGILLVVLLVDLLGYLFAAYKGTGESYVPYSRSLAVMAADAWDNRESNAIGDYYDPYAKARSLEPLTDVLDSLASAARKWGGDVSTADDSSSTSNTSAAPWAGASVSRQHVTNRQSLVFSQ